MTEEDVSPETWPIADATICGIATAELADLGVTFSAPVAAFKRRAARRCPRARRVTLGPTCHHCHGGRRPCRLRARKGRDPHRHVACSRRLRPTHHRRLVAELRQRRWCRCCRSRAHGTSSSGLMPKPDFFQLKDHIPAVFAALGIVAADASGGDRTAATGAR